MMNQRIEEIKAEIEAFEINSDKSLEQFRIQFVGRKGRLAELFDGLKDVPNEEKRAVGQALNTVKNLAEEKFKNAQEAFSSDKSSVVIPNDLTLSGPIQQGTIHPLTLVRSRILEIFNRMGFSVSDGPEIEKDFYNFTALNFPENHPAREMQDTFFIEKGKGEVQDDMLLRTHTSNVQIRLLEYQKPPIR